MENMTAKERYNQLTVDRQNALDKARRASLLTIPDLIPEDDTPTPSSSIKNTYSSFGGKAVNVLSSKLVYSLLPPSQDFFRKEIDKSHFTDEDMQRIASNIDGNGTVEDKIRRVIINNSEKISNYFESTGVRATYIETMLHLIVAGNVVVKYTETGSRNYSLNNFVIVRDNEDNMIMELITKENIHISEVPEEYQLEILNGQSVEEYNSTDVLELYTHIKYVDGVYERYSEIEGVQFDEVTYEKDLLPYVAPRMYKRSDMNYGESYVYTYYDDLRDLNNFRRYFVRGSAALTKIIYLVKPRSQTNPRDLAKAKDGGFVIGREEDISQLQPKNLVQIQELRNMIYEIKEDLKESFLMLAVRNSERTTAEEVRKTQEENDVQLGGVFSVLSQELQLPSIGAVEGILIDSDSGYVYIPSTKNKVITGVEAIGRSQETNVLRTFINLTLESAQATPAIIDYVNEEWVKNQILKASGVNDEAMLSKSDVDNLRQVRNQQAQQAALQAQMLESGGKMAEQAVKNNN